MDFYKAQEFMKNLYPNKEIKFDLDDKCHRITELIWTDGKPNPVHHVECNKLKCIVDGHESMYIDIIPHRFCWDYETMMEHQIKKYEEYKANKKALQGIK